MKLTQKKLFEMVKKHGPLVLIVSSVEPHYGVVDYRKRKLSAGELIQWRAHIQNTFKGFISCFDKDQKPNLKKSIARMFEYDGYCGHQIEKVKTTRGKVLWTTSGTL